MRLKCKREYQNKITGDKSLISCEAEHLQLPENDDNFKNTMSVLMQMCLPLPMRDDQRCE